MKYLIILSFFVCVEVSYGASETSNTVRAIWNGIKECAKNEKCTIFCALNKLKVADAEGNIQMTAIPYNNLYKNETLVKCMEKNKKKDKCEKVTEVVKCVIGTERTIYQNNLKKCAKETKYSVPKIHSIRTLLSTFFDTKYRCYSRCLLVQENVIGADNHFTNDFITSVVKDHGKDGNKISEIFKTCGERKDSDKCEEVFDRGLCFFEELIFTNL